MEKTVSDWIRSHLLFTAGMQPSLSMAEVDRHISLRLDRCFALIRSRVGLGLIRYEYNRGRSPCYLKWLECALDRYKMSKNIDALLDVAFYAMAEFQDPSIDGTFYNPNRDERDER